MYSYFVINRIILKIYVIAIGCWIVSHLITRVNGRSMWSSRSFIFFPSNTESFSFTQNISTWASFNWIDICLIKRAILCLFEFSFTECFGNFYPISYAKRSWSSAKHWINLYFLGINIITFILRKSSASTKLIWMRSVPKSRSWHIPMCSLLSHRNILIIKRFWRCES